MDTKVSNLNDIKETIRQLETENVSVHYMIEILNLCSYTSLCLTVCLTFYFNVNRSAREVLTFSGISILIFVSSTIKPFVLSFQNTKVLLNRKFGTSMKISKRCLKILLHTDTPGSISYIKEA